MLEREIFDYLVQRYRPEAVVVYGSFADGSAGQNSDFDALVIAPGAQRHDASTVSGTVLDVFVYPPETFTDAYDPEDFVQVFDGKILLDEHGTAARLKSRVLDYLESLPRKSADERQQEADWCRKMLLRAQRGDAEGLYRWHWLLSESLELYCDGRGWRCFGPKKTLRRLALEDAAGFALCERALREFSPDALSAWIGHVEGVLRDTQA